jgi:hypothetical protein
MDPPLDLGFIIDTVKTTNALKECVKFGVAPWILRYFKVGFQGQPQCLYN